MAEREGIVRFGDRLATTRISQAHESDSYERQITVRPAPEQGVNVAIELWGQPANIAAGLSLSTVEAGELVAAIGRALGFIPTVAPGAESQCSRVTPEPGEPT